MSIVSIEAIDIRTRRLMAIGPRVKVLDYVLELLHANSYDTAAALDIDIEEAGESLRALRRLDMVSRYPRIPGTPLERWDYKITPRGLRTSLALAAA